ncbi:MAG: hypothetical protein ACP5IL_13415 [Syntrophobacteraceae bacterium]
MDIIIGDSPRIGASDPYRREANQTFSIEAKYLGIRDNKEQDDYDDERPRGRVLSLLIPEGQNVPHGVETGEYRIYLRFVRRYP